MESDTYTTPFPRSYWVIPGKFLAGEYPGAQDTVEAEFKLNRLVDCGIQKIINLMEPDETDHSGKPFSDYEFVIPTLANRKGVAVLCQRFAIPDLGIPNVRQMQRILNAVDDGIDNGKPVYVHCWGGIGRTGTVVGCYLLSKGIAHSGNVLDVITHLRKNEPKSHLTSPETVEQRKFVAHWAARRFG